MTGASPNESIKVFAPARIDLSPGFTDVDPFCVELPGSVVNIALNLGVEVTVCEEMARDWNESFVSRLCAAVAGRLGIAQPIVRLSTSLPAGSGLGISGALSVALSYALSVRAAASVRPADLVELACAAERDAGLAGGTQDQLASVHGGVGVVRRHRDLGSRESIDTDLTALESRIVLVYGRGSRNSGSIIEQVLARPRQQVLRTLAGINEVADAVAHSLRGADFSALAELMTASTALLRDLHPSIVDSTVEQRLRTLGAHAAKPCGAGGPGAAWVVLVAPDSREDIVNAVASSGFVVLPAAPSAAGVTSEPKVD